MGCDGGTIPRRDELVRTKQKPEQVSSSVIHFDVRPVSDHRVTESDIYYDLMIYIKCIYNNIYL